MIDKDKIFSGSGYSKTTNIMELMLALVDPSNSLQEKRDIWNEWEHDYYNFSDLREFFHESLFNDGFNFLDVFVREKNYKNFYELAMSLDMANIDQKAYYLFFILNYGHKFYTQIVKDAFEYDQDTILSIFPDIKEVILANN